MVQCPGTLGTCMTIGTVHNIFCHASMNVCMCRNSHAFFFCRASSRWSQVAWLPDSGHTSTSMPWGYITHPLGRCTGCTKTPPCTRYCYESVAFGSLETQHSVLFGVPSLHPAVSIAVVCHLSSCCSIDNISLIVINQTASLLLPLQTIDKAAWYCMVSSTVIHMLLCIAHSCDSFL